MLYIAYGSNLNRRQMRFRCPAAKPICGFALDDYRLVFRGVADIEPAEGATVHAGLWRITAACERALDRYEGVGSGLYRKEYVPVSITYANGKVEDDDALVYRMNADYLGWPGESYFLAIREGYRDFGLPVKALYGVLDTQRKLMEAEL